MDWKASRIAVSYGPARATGRRTMMNTRRGLHIPLVLALAGLAGPGVAAQSVTLTTSHPNIVSFRNDIANRTVLARIP
jgi:hypothetical protein